MASLRALRLSPWVRRSVGPRVELLVESLECRDWGAELVRERSAVELRPPTEELVYGLKYGGWAGSAALLGGRMVWYAIPPDLASGPYLVVPVPTTAKRLRSRGYNQAQLLAEAVSGGVGRPSVGGARKTSGRPHSGRVAPGSAPG